MGAHHGARPALDVPAFTTSIRLALDRPAVHVGSPVQTQPVEIGVVLPICFDAVYGVMLFLHKLSDFECQNGTDDQVYHPAHLYEKV